MSVSSDDPVPDPDPGPDPRERAGPPPAAAGEGRGAGSLPLDAGSAGRVPEEDGGPARATLPEGLPFTGSGRDLEVTVITGMSGAGRSEAADVLEDLGFFVIDNLPTALIGKVAELARGAGRPTRYALGVDVRAGAFVDELDRALGELREQRIRTRVLFLDASGPTLVRRFDESRRPHPLGDRDRVVEAIERERDLLADLRGRSDLVIDTTDLNVHELRDRIRDLFTEGQEQRELKINVVSFGYKHGLPLDVDLVFDCRFLSNPHWVESLRDLPGTDPAVRDYVMGQPATAAFLEELGRLFDLLVPSFQREGKAYLSIGVGCTGGRHRSVVIADELGSALRRAGYPARVHHRDLRRG